MVTVHLEAGFTSEPHGLGEPQGPGIGRDHAITIGAGDGGGRDKTKSRIEAKRLVFVLGVGN